MPTSIRSGEVECHAAIAVRSQRTWNPTNETPISDSTSIHVLPFAGPAHPLHEVDDGAAEDIDGDMEAQRHNARRAQKPSVRAVRRHPAHHDPGGPEVEGCCTRPRPRGTRSAGRPAEIRRPPLDRFNVGARVIVGTRATSTFDELEMPVQRPWPVGHHFEDRNYKFPSRARNYIPQQIR